MSGLPRYGLVGAGPWARDVHIPGALAAPDVDFQSVFARRRDAAESALAGVDGVQVVDDFDELLRRSDIVGFAVPPDVQLDLAIQAARAGKHLLLEKPTAFSTADAERLADAVDESGVRSIVFFTALLDPAQRAWVQTVRDREARLVVVRNLSDVLADESNPFGQSPWRHERGALWDSGAHDIAMLLLILGPIAEVSARRGTGDLVLATTRHINGGIGSLTLGADFPSANTLTTAFTSAGAMEPPGLDWLDTARASVSSALGALARGAGSELDARFGVQVVEVMEAVERSAAVGGPGLLPENP